MCWILDSETGCEPPVDTGMDGDIGEVVSSKIYSNCLFACKPGKQSFTLLPRAQHKEQAVWLFLARRLSPTTIDRQLRRLITFTISSLFKNHYEK